MNVGKSLFAQMMEFVPWKTFGRIIERYKGDAGVRTLSCADLFRVMAFAQLTWRRFTLGGFWFNPGSSDQVVVVSIGAGK